MIVHDLNVSGITTGPAEANPPLVVDTNTVLPRPITAQGLQTIPWNRSQIRNGSGGMHLIELSLRHRRNPLKLPAELSPEDPLGLLVMERPNHTY